MAYTKTVWETGDVITAAKLNNAEGGIESANKAFCIAKATAIPDDPNSNFELDLTFDVIEYAYLHGYAGVELVDENNLTTHYVYKIDYMYSDETPGSETWSLQITDNNSDTLEFYTDTEGGTLKTHIGE